MTNKLATWLREQIAEDQRIARAAARLHEGDPEQYTWDTIVGRLEDAGWDPLAVARLDEHVTNWDPQRALAECAAKLKVVEGLEGAEAALAAADPANDKHHALLIDSIAWYRAAQEVALSYAFRPGYRLHWG